MGFGILRGSSQYRLSPSWSSVSRGSYRTKSSRCCAKRAVSAIQVANHGLSSILPNPNTQQYTAIITPCLSHRISLHLSRVKVECAKPSYTVIEGQNCPTPPRMIKTPTAKFTIRLHNPQSAVFFFQAAGFCASGSSGLTRYLRSPSLRGRRSGRH